jgi:hypothetical protein
MTINVSKKISLSFFLIPGNFWILLMLWRQTFSVNNSRVISLFDDALISMSYAKTFSQTGNLVWFPGAEKVQGITNPLWTIILSGFHLISENLQIVILLVIFLNLLIINLVAVLVYKLLEKLLPKHPYKQHIMLGVAASIPFQYSYVYWTIRGLEVGFLSLILLLTLFLAFKNEKITFKNYVLISTLGCLGIATRFDYFLIHFLIMFFLIHRSYFVFKKDSIKLFNIGLLLPMFLCVFAIIAWQKIYYGDFLPNTYYLKVVGYNKQDVVIRGLYSVLKSFLTPVVFLFIITIMMKKSTNSKKARDFFYLSSTILLSVICYAIYVGGDAWETFGKTNRFISVAQPLYIILLGFGISLFLSDKYQLKIYNQWATAAVLISTLGYGIRLNPLRYSFAFALTVFLVISIFFYILLKTRLSQKVLPLIFIICIISSNTLSIASWILSGAKDGMDASDRYTYQVAIDINSILKQNGKAAVLYAGSPIYFSDRGGVDLLGKNDTYVARQKPNFTDYVGEWNSTFYPGHNKWNFEHSIGKLKPDMIAQSWGQTKIAEFGYAKFCLINSDRPYYLNPASDKVNWPNVTEC